MMPQAQKSVDSPESRPCSVSGACRQEGSTPVTPRPFACVALTPAQVYQHRYTGVWHPLRDHGASKGGDVPSPPRLRRTLPRR